MTITTTLTWTRYNGTPETLPEEDAAVLVLAKDGHGGIHSYPCTLEEDEADGILEWDDSFDSIFVVSIGDMWAYFPKAPEVGA